MLRFLLLIVVAVGIAFAVSHAMSSASANSGPGKAASTIKTLASQHGIVVDGASCHASAVPPSSIPYVAQLQTQGYGAATMYDCDVTLTSSGIAPQTWCVPGFPGSQPWTAVLKSCEAWASGA
jgi:hypothetical protein